MQHAEYPPTSPWHAGESLIQAGIDAQLAVEMANGQDPSESFLPDPYLVFMQDLPFVVIGGELDNGEVWCTLVVGVPGRFISSEDPRYMTLTPAAGSEIHGDPLMSRLKRGSKVAVLAIKPHIQKRLRIGGRVANIDKNSLTLEIREAFGNCPQYIHRREAALVPLPRALDAVYQGKTLDARGIQLLTSADTFYIATSYPHDHPKHGADVSHKSGKAGFIHVIDTQKIQWPDFRGNNYFNSLGNISLNPRAGMLVFDPDTKEAIFLSLVDVQVNRKDASETFAGAIHVITATVNAVVRSPPGSVPLQWSAARMSRDVQRTGEW